MQVCKLVGSPFVLYGGVQNAKILAPVSTVPVAVSMVAAGTYVAVKDYEMLMEEKAAAAALLRGADTKDA